jgi:hypothetical protein
MPKVVIKLKKKVFPNEKLFHMLPVYILIKVRLSTNFVFLFTYFVSKMILCAPSHYLKK